LLYVNSKLTYANNFSAVAKIPSVNQDLLVHNARRHSSSFTAYSVLSLIE